MRSVFRSEFVTSSKIEIAAANDDQGGVYYEGYMRACAPHYELKRFDRPVFNDVQCNSLEKFVCQFGMNKYFCDMRDWEKAVSCHLLLGRVRNS